MRVYYTCTYFIHIRECARVCIKYVYAPCVYTYIHVYVRMYYITTYGNYAVYNNRLLRWNLSRLYFSHIDRAALVSFFLFRFNRRSSVHGSLVGRKQWSSICHFRHQRHSVFANSANAPCRSPRRHVAATGFGGFHTSSGIIVTKIVQNTLAMIWTLSKQMYVRVHALVMAIYY